MVTRLPTMWQVFKPLNIGQGIQTLKKPVAKDALRVYGDKWNICFKMS